MTLLLRQQNKAPVVCNLSSLGSNQSLIVFSFKRHQASQFSTEMQVDCSHGKPQRGKKHYVSRVRTRSLQPAAPSRLVPSYHSSSPYLARMTTDSSIARRRRDRTFPPTRAFSCFPSPFAVFCVTPPCLSVSILTPNARGSDPNFRRSPLIFCVPAPPS